MGEAAEDEAGETEDGGDDMSDDSPDDDPGEGAGAFVVTPAGEALLETAAA